MALKSTGEEIITRAVKRFGLCDDTICISFDTTASNTVLIQETCTRIEKEFGRIVVVGFRHHSHELILKGVFEGCCGRQPSGPDIQVFWK